MVQIVGFIIYISRTIAQYKNENKLSFCIVGVYISL